VRDITAIVAERRITATVRLIAAQLTIMAAPGEISAEQGRGAGAALAPLYCFNVKN
jgi:hypothetical protein